MTEKAIPFQERKEQVLEILSGHGCMYHELIYNNSGAENLYVCQHFEF